MIQKPNKTSPFLIALSLSVVLLSACSFTTAPRAVMSAGIATKTPLATIPAPVTPEPDTCITSNVAGAWLHNAPDYSEDTRVVALVAGTRVTVLSAGNWDYIRAGDVTGYVLARYVGVCDATQK